MRRRATAEAEETPLRRMMRQSRELNALWAELRQAHDAGDEAACARLDDEIEALWRQMSADTRRRREALR